jgi:hypothetical protein
VLVAVASSCFAHLARELTDELKPFELVPGACSVRSTDFGTWYLQELYPLKERGKREEYLRGKLHLS